MPIMTMMMTVKLKIFPESASKSRVISDMIGARNYDGILEIQLYNAQYGVYDPERGTSLLMLAFQEKRSPIISHLLRNLDQDDWYSVDSGGRNILDFYMMD